MLEGMKLSKFRELVNSCPSLSDYEKSLLIQINVEEKAVTKVAKELGKAKSTVSSQNSKAFQKFIDWLKISALKPDSADFDALVFKEFNTGHTPAQIIAKYGHAGKIKKLSDIWKETEHDDYWKAVRYLRDYGAISDSDEDISEPLYNGVLTLCEMVTEAWGDAEEAEKKLADYEKKFGTVKELAATKDEIENDIERLEKRRTEFKDEIDSLVKIRDSLFDEKEELERKIKGLNTKIEELDKQALKAGINREMLQSQLSDLKKNLRYYRTRHGRNVKVAMLVKAKGLSTAHASHAHIKRNDSPILKDTAIGSGKLIWEP